MKKIALITLWAAFLLNAASCSGAKSAEACTLTASGSVVVLERPGSDSAVSSILDAGATETAVVRTSDGFFGFDPGDNPAGTLGVFRYRWIKSGAGVTETGGCGSLPTVAGPKTGVCYVVARADASVYPNADETTAPIATMHAGDFAALVGTTPEWVNVDLSVGNLGLNKQGWVSQSNAGFNGPCGPLTETTPG
jgi:hypothetical protein